ncbi:MAG: glycosyltransferase family 4 protein [Chloroflexi bacterium]|nr:glycosyltransferase family 4 protein [Chloroflexota bacterium]
MHASKTLKRVCLTPPVSGVGGMVSFQTKMTAGLIDHGIQVTFDLADEPYNAVLVIGGTRQLVPLRRMHRRGIPVVQRLDGMNWLHRRLHTGVRHWLRAEIGNWLLAYTRERFANRVVYQSRFVRDWWARTHGAGPSGVRIIYNGVDLDLFNPNGEKPKKDHVRILMVEGNLQGGYEMGLESAVALANHLQQPGKQVELVVAGQIGERVKAKWHGTSSAHIHWAGVVPNNQLPALYQSAHFLYSADLNAACPNSVIEAMACGLPVLAFDTGALKELVSPQAGRVVSYGGNPWKLDPPNNSALVGGATEILSNQHSLRLGARARAEEAFSLDAMVDAYIEALNA